MLICIFYVPFLGTFAGLFAPVFFKISLNDGCTMTVGSLYNGYMYALARLDLKASLPAHHCDTSCHYRYATFGKKTFQMAIVKLNSITEGLSGKFGKTLVLKQYGKKTIAARRPHIRKKRTQAQRACADAFRQAARFAKAATSNPEIKAYYATIARQRNQHSAYVALIQDFRKSPIPLTQDHLLERARKAAITKEESTNANVHVLEVTVTAAHGEIIVRGMAVRSDEGNWHYASAYSDIRISIREICR